MQYDMDGFWTVRPGSSNTLWNALSGPLRLGKLNARLTPASIAVCLLTDDWTPSDWDILMGWQSHRRQDDTPGQVVAAYEGHEAVHAAAQANSLSVTRAGGWAGLDPGRGRATPAVLRAGAGLVAAGAEGFARGARLQGQGPLARTRVTAGSCCTGDQLALGQGRLWPLRNPPIAVCKRKRKTPLFTGQEGVLYD